MSLLRSFLALCGAALPFAIPTPGGPVLSVLTDSGWITWWDSQTAPTRWIGPHPDVAQAVAWQALDHGVDYGELLVDGAGAWGLRIALVRLDPRLVRLELSIGTEDGQRASWDVDDAAGEALVAINAGQFTEWGPWGWVLHRGAEIRPPGSGPLAVALVIDRAGSVHWVRGDSLASVRASGSAVEAFQSYPVLLDESGTVPRPLRQTGLGVDLSHRDSRLALGQLRDGRLLLALTRLDSRIELFTAAPWGPTVPEMAAMMGALGCHRAVLLDGGISGQMLLRAQGKVFRRWIGFRKVPMALMVFPRSGRAGSPP